MTRDVDPFEVPSKADRDAARDAPQARDLWDAVEAGAADCDVDHSIEDNSTRSRAALQQAMRPTSWLFAVGVCARLFARMAPMLTPLVASFAGAHAHAAGVVGAKQLCDAFEGAEQDAWYACQGKQAQDPHAARVLEKYTRARQQCRELLGFSQSAGRIKMTSEGAQRCIDARIVYVKDRTRSQANAAAMRKACDEAIVGTVTGGGKCDSAFECAPGLACIGPKGSPPGVCRAPLASGEACDENAPNTSTLHAIIATARPTCGAENHCVASATGTSCKTNRAVGASCDAKDPRACGPGYACREGACAGETRVKFGGRCAEHSDCAADGFCDYAGKAATAGGTCAPRRSKGAVCTADEECRGACDGQACRDVCGSG